MTTRTVMWFFAMAFGLGWGLGIALVVFRSQIEAVFGPISGTNPVFILIVYSPSIAAVFLTWRHYGFGGVGSLLRRVTLWRMPIGWWTFLLLGIPIVKTLAAAIQGTLDDPFPFSAWYDVIPAAGLALVIGPLGEEFGWRGLALPLLQRRFAPLWASLILGLIWGVWHLPAFLLSGTPQSAWSFGPFMLGVLALGVLVTPMFNAAKGSILVPILFHFQMNLPLWPEAQPVENYLFAMVALLVVLLDWRRMGHRGDAVTEVLMPGSAREERDEAVPLR